MSEHTNGTKFSDEALLQWGEECLAFAKLHASGAIDHLLYEKRDEKD